MDVALRAVSWIWGFHFFARSDACRDSRVPQPRFCARCSCTASSSSSISRRPISTATTTCATASAWCFSAASSGAPRPAAAGSRSAARIVEHEIFEQTTPDGVDFEQSTAYHRLVLEAFLTSYQLLRRHGEQVRRSVAGSGSSACASSSQAYTKPDGRAPLIGDADDGRVQILGTQAIGDHRYLLSTRRRPVRPRRTSRSRRARCWDETFWLLGPERAGWSSTAAGATAAAHRRRFPTAASTCCAARGRTSSSIAATSACAAAAATATTTSSASSCS